MVLVVVSRLAILFSLFLLASCRSGGEPGGKKEEVPLRPLPRNFTLLSEEPRTLDPAFVDDTYSSNIVCQTFDGLITVDENLKLVPELARTWSVSADGSRYTFELVSDARFHNGKRVTAHDFVHTFTRIFLQGPGAPSIGREYLKGVVGVDEFVAGKADTIRGLRAYDATHFCVELDSPDATFLAAMAMPNFKVVPPEADEPGFARRPIGAGPFIFEEWKPADRITLKANLAYHRGRPKLNEVQFLITGTADPQAQVEMFRRGRVQIIQAVGEDAAFLAKEGYPILNRSELSLHYLGFNCAKTPFVDVRVRKAVAASINYDRFGIFEPLCYLPATGLIPPGMQGYAGGERPYAYDPIAAAKLLSEAGYAGGKLNTEIDFVSYAGESGIGVKIENVIIDDLSKIGLRLKKREVPWVTFNEMVARRELSFYRLAWVADIPDTSSVLYSLFYSHALNNSFSFSNADVDRLLSQARVAFDPVAKTAMYQEAQEKILQDVPLIPLDFGCYNYARQPYVRGLVLNPYGLADTSLENVYYER
ncbi:MAG: ABC transporter substrate-binding protein [Acidobacteria bacterium]|nr:ABC transporter substrate-binding protein [Acidobacteriota bacterium]